MTRKKCFLGGGVVMFSFSVFSLNKLYAESFFYDVITMVAFKSDGDLNLVC